MLLRNRFALLFVLAVGLSDCKESNCQELQSPARASENYDSQEVFTPLVPPSKVAAEAKLPKGFTMQPVASEPDIQQPIGMAWDAKGRLWVAENYTYSEASINLDRRLSDRIIILEDTNGDGTFDKRKVFWDEGKQLTSIEIGNKGIWAVAAPYLLFLSDANEDDVLDGPPKIVLDGFDEGMRHNFVNGLRFGPDGWLYGRHGILGVSNVGFPQGSPSLLKASGQKDGASEAPVASFSKKKLFDAFSFRGSSERKKIHCGIWRFNTVTSELEWVTQGTTNPWGMDWDQHGNLFFINTVIGHLWHAIPNSHLQRMYGEDLDPYTYDLLPQIADHVHWDEKGEDWREAKKGALSAGTNAAGGGHAHSGMMIYQANNWPKEYQNQLFTLNFHGQRMNQEDLVRKGAGFVGQHKPDMVFWNDPWYRGIELSTGPDGSVYVLDWSDLGECHENDGVHRHSGRIYRIAYSENDKSSGNAGAASQISSFKGKDLNKLSSDQLLELLNHPNAWYARFSQEVIKNAYSSQDEASKTKRLNEKQIDSLEKQVASSKLPSVTRLRSLWLLSCTNNLDAETVNGLLRANESEEIHAAVVRLIGDYGLMEGSEAAALVYEELLSLLNRNRVTKLSGLVRLYLASCQPKLMANDWRLATLLAESSDLADDRDFPLMLWYGIKDHVAQDPIGAAKLCSNCKIPKVTELIIRRLASLPSTANDPSGRIEGLELLVSNAAASGTVDQLAIIVKGMWTGLQGRRSALKPAAWDTLLARIEKQSDASTREQAVLLQSVFGGKLDPSQLIRLATDSAASMPSRKSAIESLATVEGDEVRNVLWNLLEDQFLGGAAATSIAKMASEADAKRLANSYGKVWPPGKTGIIAGLSSKQDLMSQLLDAIEVNLIPISAVDASTWRNFQLVGDWPLLQRARKLNPKLMDIDADKEKLIHDLESLLTENALAEGDPSRGRAIWQTACANCHRLFAEGSQIGPELTGAQRTNIRYWTENILAPSAQVATNYRLEMFRLNDGTSINGVPVTETSELLTIQTDKEKVTIAKEDIEARKQSTLSLMPEGLLNPLSDQAKLDLFRYLMSPNQIPVK